MLSSTIETEVPGQKLNLDRREIVKMGLGALLTSVLPLFPTRQAWAKRSFKSWKIAFRHAHTGETFAGVYRVGDKYLPEAFERMNYVLRDFRTEEVFPMDPRILDILSLLYQRLDASEAYQVLSGYRSPKTNAMLRGESSGVARNSFHMYGQAIDIRIPGQNTKIVRNTALDLRAGGVGYYPRSNFVHVDTGKVRSW